MAEYIPGMGPIRPDLLEYYQQYGQMPEQTKKKPKLMGLIGSDPSSPEAQGLLALGASLLQASGPSHMPTTFGQAMGGGLQNMMQAQNRARQAQMQREEFEAQRAHQAMQGRLINAQIDQMQYKSQGVTDFQRDLMAAGIAPDSPEGQKILRNRYDKSFMTPLQQVDLQNKLRELQKPNLSKGQEAVDKKFADEYVDFKAAGGFADVQKGLGQLNEVLGSLESGKGITGGFAEKLPIYGDASRTVWNPEGQAVKDSVEEVVQRNLRLILGAQFTEKEGARLIARAYNPALGDAENAKRVRRLITQIGTAAKAKQEAADYFEQNGTLTGFKGKIYTSADFMNMKFDDPKGGNAGGGIKFLGFE